MECSAFRYPNFCIKCFYSKYFIYYRRTRFVFLRLKREGSNFNTMGISYFGSLLQSFIKSPTNLKNLVGAFPLDSITFKSYRTLSKALTKIFEQPHGKCSNGRKLSNCKIPQNGFVGNGYGLSTFSHNLIAIKQDVFEL